MQTLILLYFFIINLVGFLLMLVDKRRAIKHEWRISELKLFVVSIIGGSIGSYLGMHCFRHKTKSLKVYIRYSYNNTYTRLFSYYTLIIANGSSNK